MAAEIDELGFEVDLPLGHPGRAWLQEGQPTGPAIGTRLPDFELPDISGRKLRFHEDRGAAKAVVVFFRSVVW